MDAKDIQSDLHALKKLYGLVKKDGDGTSNTATDLLDEHARLLLKNLLDAETKRVLKLHSEIIAGQVEEPSRTHSPTHLQQPDESSNEQPTPPPKSSIIAESSQSFEKEIMKSNNDTKPDGLDITFWKEKRFGGVEHRQKRCRLCQRNTVKQMESIDDARFYDDAQNSKISTDVVAKVCNSDIEATTKPEEVDSLSKEASKAIEQIELCISSFHIGADHLHDLPSLTAEEINRMYWLSNQTSKPVRPTKAVLGGSTYDFVGIRPGLGSEASGELGESIEEFNFPRQNVKAIIDNIESRNWIMSCYNFVPSRVQNFSVQQYPSETSYRTPTWPVTFSTASKMEGPIQRRTGMEDECSKRRLFQTYNKPSGCFTYPNNTEIIRSGDVSSILRARGKNHGNQSDAQQKDGIRKNRHYITAKRASLRHLGSDGTATDSYSNRGNDSDSDSEEYSLTDRSGEYVSSSTWSESGTESQYNNSYTGNSETDVIYSSASSVADRKSTSSTSEGYSSFDQPIRSTYSSTSKKSGPSKTRKANGKNRKKQTGMWKRMKDKMAIIFHHHHHHHHHHHDRDGKDQTSSSLQKRKGKVINFNRRDEEAYGEKAVEKMRKSLVHEKNQQSHFHGLMEGFLRHVRHSKQSKTGKETNIGELAKGHHGKQKTLNKSHWWKLMQHHRGAKLQNKTQVKLGLGKKKARLKALPR